MLQYLAIEKKRLVALLAHASDDETRAHLSSLWVARSGAIAATDGHRLAYVERLTRNNSGDALPRLGNKPDRVREAAHTSAGFLIPVAAIQVAIKACGSKEAIAFRWESESPLDAPSFCDVCIIPQSWPDYTKPVPKRIDVSPVRPILIAEARAIVRVGTPEAVKSYPGTSFTFTVGAFPPFAQVFPSHTWLDPKEELATTGFGVNAGYLSDALALASFDSRGNGCAEVRAAGRLAPLTLHGRSPEDEHTWILVMPMHV